MLQEKDEQKLAGIKDDSGKPMFAYIAPGFSEGMAKVLTFGAKKYPPRNWTLGVDYDRIYSACQRHLHAYWGGEQCDPETGESHLYHAACCLMFLSEFDNQGRKELDNRERVLV